MRTVELKKVEIRLVYRYHCLLVGHAIIKIRQSGLRYYHQDLTVSVIAMTNLDVLLQAYEPRQYETIAEANTPLNDYQTHDHTDRDKERERRDHLYKSSRDQAFKPGELVYVREYQGQSEEWVSGIIYERIGKSIYRIRAGDTLCTRHRNQIRLRMSKKQLKEYDHLPLQIWFNAFEPRVDSPSPYQLQHSDDPSLQKRRHSLRTRPPIQRLTVDPHRSTYELDPQTV